MFSGIVEEKAIIKSLSLKKTGGELSIESGLDHAQTKPGDSIAIDGICLTVVRMQQQELTFDVSAETLRRSTLGSLSEGAHVNLERALEVGGRLHGHFVTGHVDGVGKLVERLTEGEGERLTIEFPGSIKKFIAEKGSVSLAGISLTVGEVNNNRFNVYIVPHTLSETTLPSKKIGSLMNVEVDILARYINSFHNHSSQKESAITEELLKENGFL